MPNALRFLLFCTLAVVSLSGFGRASDSTSLAPRYTADGALQFPEHYREWKFLTSGFDMSYSADSAPDHHMFDNVFVNPNAYDAFQKTGTWPDGTMLVLEHRVAQGKGSINRGGDFQTDEMDVEVHVRDDARFPGQWAFFAFGPTDRTSAMIPATAACYACHASHAAVNTTFVQFYPTLLPIAKAKGTLSRSYLDDEGH